MASDLVSTIVEQWRHERPDLDPTPVAVIGRLSRVARFVTDDLVEVYRRFGLSEGEFDIIATLRRTGAPFALAPSELGAATMVTKGAISKRLDALESRGLVTRSIADHDGRARIVRLTDSGVALIDEAIRAHFDNERRILDALPADDRASLERILGRWAEHFEARA